MRGLKAALYKDLKLFFSGAGLVALVLPLLLLLAFRAGMGDLSQQAYVQPFPIAVRDRDGTVMSRSLISQMGRIPLFSQIHLVEDGESDEQALSQGAAAVVTIPPYFFYDLYKMIDSPVNVTLNRDMELEGTLFQSIFTSVMDIIRANQAAGRGLYAFCYGDLTPELEAALHAETSQYLLQDTLGRQTVFDSEDEGTDVAGALERRLLSTVLAVLALFFAISSVKTLPEELKLGVLPRYRAVGGSLAAFVCSKFLTALLLTLPTLLLLWVVFPTGGILGVFLLALLLLFGAFGLLLAIAAWTGAAIATQRWGNLLLLVSLVLGGTLWPRHLLPGPLPLLGKLTLPYYSGLGLEALQRGVGLGGMLALLWPVLLMGTAGAALAFLGFRHRRTGAVQSMGAGDAPRTPPIAPSALLGTGGRLAGLSYCKLRAMAGDLPGLAVLLIAALLCGVVAANAQGNSANELRLAVSDLDKSALSQELTQRLSQRAGLSLVYCREQEGQHALLLGEVEGQLTIGPGYADAMEAGESLPLHYEGAAAAVSAQGTREIVAGQVAAQRSRLRAADLAADRLGHSLSRQENLQLLTEIDRAETAAPPLYRLATESGGALSDPFVPGPMSFAALAVLLTLLTAAPWSGSLDGRLVESRMRALPHGRLLSYGSDGLSLTVLGVLLSLCLLVPSGLPSLSVFLTAAAYAFCSAALALALIRFTAREGRVDGLAPFLALILCLLGGCFVDLSQLSPVIAQISLLTPPGLAVRAAKGALPAVAALLLEGAAFFALGMPRRKA